MANKKQRGLELAKTEERLSGIPKGGSTRTSMTKAEKIAYKLALSTLGVSAAALGTKALIKAGTQLLAKKTAQKQAIKKGRATTAAKRAEGKAEKTGEHWSKLQDKAAKQKPKSPKKGSMEDPWRLVGGAKDSGPDFDEPTPYEKLTGKEIESEESMLKRKYGPEVKKLLGKISRDIEPTKKSKLLEEVVKKRKPRKKIVGLLKQRSISNKQEHLRSMEKQEYINKILEAAKKRNVDKSKWKEIETLAEEQWLKANNPKYLQWLKDTKRYPKKKGGVVKKKVKKGYTKKYANGSGVRKARR